MILLGISVQLSNQYNLDADVDPSLLALKDIKLCLAFCLVQPRNSSKVYTSSRTGCLIYILQASICSSLVG